MENAGEKVEGDMGMNENAGKQVEGDMGTNENAGQNVEGDMGMKEKANENAEGGMGMNENVGKHVEEATVDTASPGARQTPVGNDLHSPGERRRRSDGLRRAAKGMLDSLEEQSNFLLRQSKGHKLEAAADDLTRWASDLAIDLPLTCFSEHIIDTAKAAYAVAESMQMDRANRQDLLKFSSRVSKMNERLTRLCDWLNAHASDLELTDCPDFFQTSLIGTFGTPQPPRLEAVSNTDLQALLQARLQAARRM